MALADQLLAAANFAQAMPWADVIAAAENPSSLAKDAKAVEDVIGLLPIPPLEAGLAELVIAGFVALVTASGGGTITPGASGEGQTQRNFNPGDPAARLSP